MLNIPYNVWNKWDPIKEVIVGSCVNENFFAHTKNNEIKEKLTKLLVETQEDLDNFADVLSKHGAKVHRPYVDPNVRMDPDKKQKRLQMITTQPRDDIGVLGNNLFFSNSVGGEAVPPAVELYKKTLGKDNVVEDLKEPWVQLLRKKISCTLPNWTLVGKDLFIDEVTEGKNPLHGFSEIRKGANRTMLWKLRDNIAEWIPNTEVHWIKIGGHNDACFHTCKPGVIVSLFDIQNYSETFPKWDVLPIAKEHKWWDTLNPFMEAKRLTQGKYWIPGEEKNEPLLQFINSWLDEWVGYAEETVFDVNMFMINESTACVSNYNKDVFDFFKKHKIEPIIVPLRHRFFWDGGLHCCSTDLVREGDQQSYIQVKLRTSW